MSVGDAFGPRPCASRRATACLALSAAVAIAGCSPIPPVSGECVNSKTGEHVRLVDTGMWYEAVDSKGFLAFRNTSQEWRCKVVAQ